jgi:hypothetical protein
VLELDPGALLEQLGAEVLHGAVAGRGVVELARVRLRVGDQLAEGPGRHGRVRQQHLRRVHQQAHRREVLQRVPAEIPHHRRRADVVARVLHQQRVAVRPRPRHRLRPDHAVGAGAVVHHDRAAEALGKRLGQEAGGEVGGAAGGGGHHERDRPARDQALLRGAAARVGGAHGAEEQQWQRRAAGDDRQGVPPRSPCLHSGQPAVGRIMGRERTAHQETKPKESKPSGRRSPSIRRGCRRRG